LRFIPVLRYSPPKSPETRRVCRFTVAMPPCRNVLMPAPTKRDPCAVAVSTAASRRRHQFSHASHNRWTRYLILAMETGVSSVTGQTLPPTLTLAATRMALPHGCSGWGGEGWNDTLQPRVQLRLTANKQIMWCASPSQSLTITQYCLGLIVYNIVAVKIFHRYRNIALSIRALVSTPKSPLPWGDWGPV